MRWSKIFPIVLLGWEGGKKRLIFTGTKKKKKKGYVCFSLGKEEKAKGKGREGALRFPAGRALPFPEGKGLKRKGADERRGALAGSAIGDCLQRAPKNAPSGLAFQLGLGHKGRCQRHVAPGK